MAAKPKPVEPPAGVIPAQMRASSTFAKALDVWIWSIVSGAMSGQPQVVWSERKAGAELLVAPVVDDFGPAFRVPA